MTFGTFFLPGPTEVRAEVLSAMTGPMLPHRGAAFETLFGRIMDGLGQVFRTTRPVYVSTSSATGLMEAGIRCAPPGRVLALVNGAFSERYAQIARACARETDVLAVPLGATFDLDTVRAQLAHTRYAAVTVVHSETSTGVLTDVRAITALARAAGAVCLIDSVTGIAGVPLEFDAWELDYVLTGSQKALALPPGLAFAAASDAFMRSAAASSDRGLYFDLVEFDAFARKRQTPNTPALSLLYALDAQLAAIMHEGIEARWARHAAMAAATHRWVADTSDATGVALGVLAPVGARATTVTAITLPEPLASDAIVKGVAAHGFVIGSGYGALKARTFRIGHMGDHTIDGLSHCLAACREVIREVRPA
ncbi:MAG: aminotransferase class V-fold PLP-dependent enzyme [Gemmatimonadaceae bacterium]|jgi:aspartate aminotransferase-like enzyme|nr:aminotransferase class V-fold PLP-dependent enzyme [Gemmatimonadaceae bacterium]